MKRAIDFIGELMYDASPDERSRMVRVLIRFGVIVFVLWAIGTFSDFGMHGFAMANDVDKKISSAVAPINDQLETLKAQMENSQAMQKRILAAQISSQLRDLNRLRCSTKDQLVRSRMEQDIEAAEQEYRQLTGERYPLAACKDL